MNHGRLVVSMGQAGGGETLSAKQPHGGADDRLTMPWLGGHGLRLREVSEIISTGLNES